LEERLFSGGKDDCSVQRLASRKRAFREASIALLQDRFSHYTEAWYMEADQTGFGAHLAAFVRGTLALNFEEGSEMERMPEAISSYGDRALRDWVFAREWAVAGTVFDGIVLYTLGSYAAWLMTDLVDRTADVGCYGRHLSCWLRYISGPETFKLIYGDGTAWRGLLGLLE